MPAPTPRPGIMDIVAYKPGSAGSPATKIYKLSSNESALGPSPKAIAAFKAVADDLHIYPDAGASALRAAVAAEFSIDEGLVVAGAGSDEILTLLMRGYLGPGDSMVMSRHGFAIYAIATTGCGAEVIRADEENLTTHVDNLLAAVKPNTKMMMLANPNNPTGTLLSGAQLRRLRENLRDDILLVLDAAYAEYVEADDYEDGIGMVGAAIKSGADNVFTTRTFSKLYGLGGLRVGWGYGPKPVVDVLNRLRGPFNVSAPAQAAGASALADKDFVARHLDHNKIERARLFEALQELGFRPIPSHTNFLLVGMKGEDPKARAAMADALNTHLTQQGTIVRPVKEYFLPDYLRMSVGSVEANSALIEALRCFK